MFVFNMKLDGNKTSKILMGILCVIILIITGIVCYKLLFNSLFKTNDEIARKTVYELSSQNYTSVLKNVHTNLDDYVGQRVKFCGYIYRLYDFSNEQFVLARNMVISSDFQTVVVGFLCHSKVANNYEDNTWVEIEGTITKGNYNGEIPIIEVDSINKIQAPSDEYVYPPDSTFIPTSSIL